MRIGLLDIRGGIRHVSQWNSRLLSMVTVTSVTLKDPAAVVDWWIWSRQFAPAANCRRWPRTTRRWWSVWRIQSVRVISVVTRCLGAVCVYRISCCCCCCSRWRRGMLFTIRRQSRMLRSVWSAVFPAVMPTDCLTKSWGLLHPTFHKIGHFGHGRSQPVSLLVLRKIENKKTTSEFKLSGFCSQ